MSIYEHFLLFLLPMSNVVLLEVKLWDYTAWPLAPFSSVHVARGRCHFSSTLPPLFQVKYLGRLFHSETAFSPSFVNLKQKIRGAWALSQRQYGQLQCLSSCSELAWL
jgi:hypothetical protein